MESLQLLPAFPPPPLAGVVLDPVWQAAVRADAGGQRADSLASAWDGFASGRLRASASYAHGDRVYLVGYSTGRSGKRDAFSAIESEVFLPVLCGDQQKAIAANLAIAPSTVSHRFGGALRKLGIARDAVPLPLVIAAHHRAGIQGETGATSAEFEAGGRACLVISVRRPRTERAHVLTPAEIEVARLCVEGLTRTDIASYRATSVLTVARQVHSIFTALGIVGRYALIRRLVELGCLS
jgi:DNA-binding NarL/FixJ family response regulator